MSVVLLICAIYEITAERNVKLIITYFIFGISSQALFVTMLASRDLTKKVRAKVRRSDIRAISVVSVLSALSGFLYLYTLNTANNISLIISLSSFVLPLTALASYWLFSVWGVA